MKFKMRFVDQIVGLFIVVAALFLIFLIGSMSISQNWFERRHNFISEFPSAKGLAVGMTITYKGFEIGRVSDVQLTDQNKVAVTYYVRDRYYGRVTERSVLQLVSNPLGLGGGLVFHPGSSAGPPMPDGSSIPSWDTPRAVAWRADGLVEMAQEDDAVGAIISQIGPMLGRISDTATSIKELANTADETFKGDQDGSVRRILSRTSDAISGVGTTVIALREGTSTTLERADEVLANLNEVSENLKMLTARLTDPEGIVPKLLGAKGSIVTLLDDDNALADRIDAILDNLKQSVAEIRNVAGYLSDTTPQLSTILEEGRRAVNTGQDVLTGIKNNPLIRGGIPAQQTQPSTFQGYRGKEF